MTERDVARAFGARERQLVATVGPASYDHIGSLVAAGATALRLNSSHLRTAELAETVRAFRQQTSSPIIIDLQGAKMRLGWFSETRLGQGESIRFVLSEGETHAKGTIPTPHPELFAAARPGETITIDDGSIRLRIDDVSNEHIEATSLADATLRPRKGINRLEHPVEPTDLCIRDIQAIAETRTLESISYALSFVSTVAELEWVRRRATTSEIIAKAERPEAIERLGDLAREAEAIWICRGDLGAQLGPIGAAKQLRHLRPSEYPCPILMAGQVFEHLTHHESPTRSEVCHLADLLDKGYAGVVLSDETAIGSSPIRAVRIVSELLAGL